MIIRGNDLIMTKGDTEYLTVELLDADDVARNYDIGDTIYFTVKYNSKMVEKVFQKVITTFSGNEAVIKIEPRDTKDLLVNRLEYDIQLTKANGDITTLIPPPDQKAYLILGGEITYD